MLINPVHKARRRNRRGDSKPQNKIKIEAARIAAENIAFNAGRPQHEHRTTSIRKIRKQVRRYVRVAA